MKEQTKRFIEQAETLQKLGNFIKKKAKTEEDKIKAEVCLGMSEVALALAEFCESLKVNNND